MSDRAAVFTSQPQDVEIYERGAWWPGKMLGWRHDAAGGCQGWVRVEFAGVVEDAWVDLSLLRLPEHRPARRRHAAPDPGAVLTGRRAGRAASAVRDGDEPRTQHLPPARDGEACRDGRPGVSSGGRRRAPEPSGETESETGGRAQASVPTATRAPGRHRAPADPGRHRAADTGILAVVSPEATLSAARTSPPPRTELAPPGPALRSRAVRVEEEPEGLTRPMRLEEGVGSARRWRRDALSRA